MGIAPSARPTAKPSTAYVSDICHHASCGLVIADRAIALWPLKLGGHILDPYGRHVRAVPVALWEDSAAATAEESLLAPFRPAGEGGPAARRGV
ncbi:hypothetical protein ACIGW1_27480 [Streptomyces sp. NPDC053780]|uniref:hypothetical protein n=1 Tax=unclassified Streptomyces TaxID=2593676 RepID=UPI00343526E6